MVCIECYAAPALLLFIGWVWVPFVRFLSHYFPSLKDKLGGMLGPLENSGKDTCPNNSTNTMESMLAKLNGSDKSSISTEEISSKKDS